MRFLCGLILGAMLFTDTAAAMTFSQPVEIGWIGISQRNGAGGFVFKNEISNNGDYYIGYDKNNRYSYGKGVVQFSNNTDTIFVHYDAYSKNSPAKFGSLEIDNTIPIYVFNTWIYKIPTDGKIRIYATREFYGSDSNWVIFGTKQSGEFVQYFDTSTITEKYFGIKTYRSVSPIMYSIPKCNDDIIIIPYTNRDGRDGEFRFKWDDTAQWFGVEQIIY